MLSALALLISGYAVYHSQKAYEETTIPHTQFEEIEMSLDRTKERLEFAEERVTPEIQEILDETWGAYYQAESEHMLRHFDEAKGYLRMCNELIDSMNLVAPPVPLFAFQWWWPAVVFVLIVAIVLFAVRSF